MTVKATLRAHLQKLVAIKGADGTSAAAIGRAALNDNTFFRRLERDENFTVETCDRVVQWFSDNWPEDAEWPADVPRPAKAEPEPVAS